MYMSTQISPKKLELICAGHFGYIFNIFNLLNIIN